MHEAASLGRALQLKQLIEEGASVNIVTVDNFTPLHDACIQGHPNCVKILLEAGAQVGHLKKTQIVMDLMGIKNTKDLYSIRNH